MLSRRDHERALARGVRDGVAQQPAVLGTAQRQVDDVRALVGGPADALGDVAVAAAARGAEHLDRQDLAVPADAGDADAVVAARGDHAGGHRAVPLVVVGVAVVVDEVAARQHPPGEVGQLAHPGVHHGDDHAAGAPGRLPGSADIGAGDAPLAGVGRVVGGVTAAIRATWSRSTYATAGSARSASAASVTWSAGTSTVTALGTGEPLAAEDVDAAIEGGDHVAAAVQADDQRDRRLVHRRRDGGTARQRDATHQKTDDQYPQRSHPVTMGPARWRPRTPSVAPG
nr:hypothetical protein GCM10020092_098560 [Actinoplanes digitatis]